MVKPAQSEVHGETGSKRVAWRNRLKERYMVKPKEKYIKKKPVSILLVC
jgi:hypothetical protein